MVIHALKLYRFHEVARRKLIRFEELETWQSRRWLLRIIESSSKPDHYLGRARAFFWRALISISSDTYLEKEAEVSFDRFSFFVSNKFLLPSLRKNHNFLTIIDDWTGYEKTKPTFTQVRFRGENTTRALAIVRFRYPAYPYLQA